MAILLLPWAWDPGLLVGLGIAAGWYGLGVWRVWRRAGVGRGVRRRQVLAYLGALVCLVLALLSPLATASHLLFSAHMVQHMLLINLVAPLLVFADPGYGGLWAAPRSVRRGGARWWRGQRGLQALMRMVTSPLMVWMLFALSLWIWHVPRFYQAALTVTWIHQLEHFSFLAAAMLFWWRMLDVPGREPLSHRRTHGHPRHGAYGVGIAMAFTTMLHSGLLGALLTFSPTPWYPNYVTNTASLGIGALADQQLAGVIMWVPGGLVYLFVTLGLLAKWLRRLEQSDLQQSSMPMHPMEHG